MQDIVYLAINERAKTIQENQVMNN